MESSMEFLHSNYRPVKFGYRDFSVAFFDLLQDTVSLDIAVGYVTSDSLMELRRLTELNDNIRNVNLTIGMHYFDRFTRIQYDAANLLNNFLMESGRGEVRLVTSFKYHGKLYSFSDAEGVSAGIIGSNNLGSIVNNHNRLYESAVLIRDKKNAREIKNFIDHLRVATDNISDLDINQFDNTNTLLEDHEKVIHVQETELERCKSSLTTKRFDIPINGNAPKSNLNVFFGRGRREPNGLVKPRHWYEAELIVPSSVTSQAGYPESKTDFQVITDDRWKFTCRISGDNNKNFRSKGDLKILGKWLKGRLENSGALEIGSPVTNETLERYGRDTFTLIKTEIPGLWYLDFGV